VELHCADVVQVASKRKHTFFHLVVPNFNEVVVTSRDEHGLSLVKFDSTHGAYVC